MKIAYFVSNRSIFPSSKNEITASSTVVSSIIKYLSQRHEVTLYAAKGSTSEPNVEIVDLNLPPTDINQNNLNPDWVSKINVGMKQIYIGEIFANAHKFDLIHLHTEPIYLGMPYISLLKTPVLFTSHNEYHNAESSLFSFYNEKIYFSGLSKTQVANIPFTKSPPVIYNGLEVETFPFEKEAQDYFLFLGRLHQDKGIEMFLNLVKSLPNTQFYIVGKGEKKIEDNIRLLERSVNNLKFFGIVPRLSTEWFSLLSNARALVSPTQYIDACPLVPLEAMACGTPVIAFPRGALPEQVVNMQTGIITNDCSLPALKVAVEHISSLPIKDYKQMRSQAHTHVNNNFSAEKMALQYERLYIKIIEDFHKRK